MSVIIAGFSALSWSDRQRNHTESAGESRVGRDGWSLLRNGSAISVVHEFSSIDELFSLMNRVSSPSTASSNESSVSSDGRSSDGESGGEDASPQKLLPAGSVVVEGWVVDVQKGRAFLYPTDPDASHDGPEVPFDEAPPGATLSANLVVRVADTISGSLPPGVGSSIRVEVPLPVHVSVDELRAAFLHGKGIPGRLGSLAESTESGTSGRVIWFLYPASEFDRDVPGRRISPPDVFRILGETLVFTEDSSGRLRTPLDEVLVRYAGDIDSIEELRALGARAIQLRVN